MTLINDTRIPWDIKSTLSYISFDVDISVGKCIDSTGNSNPLAIHESIFVSMIDISTN